MDGKALPRSIVAMVDPVDWLDVGSITLGGEWMPGLVTGDVIETQLALELGQMLSLRQASGRRAKKTGIDFLMPGTNLIRCRAMVGDVYVQERGVEGEVTLPLPSSQEQATIEAVLDCGLPLTLRGQPPSDASQIAIRKGGFIELVGYLWCFVSEFLGMEFHPLVAKVTRVEVLGPMPDTATFVPVLLTLDTQPKELLTRRSQRIHFTKLSDIPTPRDIM